MRTFELQPDSENYRWLTLVRESDFNVLADLPDSRRENDWIPLAAEWIDDALNEGKPESDFPTLGSTPVFSRRAVDALSDMLIENGELLPLALANGNYFVYNTTRVIDALDEERSELVRLSTGRVMRVVKYVFHQTVGFTPVFRIPQLRTKVFVTDRFMERVTTAGLTGFALKPVWETAHGFSTGD